MRMPRVRASKTPKGDVCAGLRILEKIIAREVVYQQRAKIDGLGADPALLGPVVAQVSDYVRNPRTDH
jgi:hypothetical protein